MHAQFLLKVQLMVLLIIDVSVILFELTHSLFTLENSEKCQTVVETSYKDKENEKSHI